MGGSVQGLREDLVRAHSFVTGEGIISFSPEEKRLLVEESGRLLERLDLVAESFLVVGLIGGTGVGKSSLMNALAGSEISTTSHRRPQTDHVLIYHHSEASLPPALSRSKVSKREISHEVDSVRQLFLCDLPDYDSLVGEHRESVLGFLEHLDMLVWVTSPEKYADERFYEFLRDVPKARKNFYFVLNKVDLLFEDQSLESGYEQLSRIITRFGRHLSEHGITHPLIYAISALEIIESGSASPWSQFPGFRSQLFQLRDVKEVVDIKASNLDVEVQQFLSRLEKEILNLEALQQGVINFAEEIKGERNDWVRSGGEALSTWLERHFSGHVFNRFSDSTSCLVGPGYLIALLVHEWRRRGERDDEQSGTVEHSLGKSAAMRNFFDRVENRLSHGLLRRGLSPDLIERAEVLPSAKTEWEELLMGLQNYTEIRLSSLSNQPMRRFVFLQYMAYSLLFLLFLFGIGGEAAWRDLVEHPEWSDVVGLISAMINTVFSPAGLAALGSYFLLKVFLGFRFYRRYKKILQRRTQRFIESLKSESESIWEERLNAMIGRLDDHSRELEVRISTLTQLCRSRKSDF
jgi:GTP-binding protein EngB required for normal cell division